MADSSASRVARELEGKVAAVTGAGAGLGRAAAVAFAAAGAAVVCNDIDHGTAEATRREIEEAGGRAVVLAGDAGTADCAAALVAAARESFGGLDIMHANAAISIYADLEEMSLETF